MIDEEFVNQQGHVVMNFLALLIETVVYVEEEDSSVICSLYRAHAGRENENEIGFSRGKERGLCSKTSSQGGAYTVLVTCRKRYAAQGKDNETVGADLML